MRLYLRDPKDQAAACEGSEALIGGLGDAVEPGTFCALSALCSFVNSIWTTSGCRPALGLGFSSGKNENLLLQKDA